LLILQVGRSHSKTAASFIRPSRTPDETQSFVQAVQQKYASEFLEGPVSSQINVISGKVAEEVGFDKIRRQLAQLTELKIVLVDGMRVNTAETDGQSIKAICPKIVELDLSRNLFESCAEIIKICRELERVKSLRLKYVNYLRRILTWTNIL